MNKKTKLVLLLITLIILITLCRIVFNINSTTYEIEQDGKKFYIEEFYKNYLYINIKVDNKIFPIQIYDNIKGRKKVNKVFYYNDDEYSCILPIVNDKVIVDMSCYKDNYLYDYHTIVGKNEELDKYVDSIKSYDINKFTNNIENKENIGSVSIYSENNINKIIAITTYKGIIVDGTNIDIFENDVYQNEISTFVSHYYLIADYTENYDFNYFYVVDLLNGRKYKIKSRNEISFDSYIQGVVNNKVYLYDKDNEKQYMIDIEKEKVELISKNNHVKYYANNKWENISINKANKVLYFDYTSLDNIFTDYDYVMDAFDYYYLFNKDGNEYKLYRVSKEDNNIIKFIATVPTTQIYYRNNYIYYKNNNYIYYYSDDTGLRTVLENTELNFNKTIKYYIY